MNSIGRMGKGQWRYYEDQVSTGRDDYYSAGACQPGRWQGLGAPSLGLQGQVQIGDVGRVFSGLDPRPELLGKQLVQDPRWETPGFDLTCLAPKSVSVLYALSGRQVRELIERAFDHANDQMLAWLEDKIAVGRVADGRGKPMQVRGTGLIVATYAHNSSRNLDPHLHRHNLILNAVQRPTRHGELCYGALDARLLYAYARAAGFLAQRMLRQTLMQDLGVRWTKHLPHGRRVVAAAPGTKEIQALNRRDWLMAFSTRRQQILELLDAMGYSSARAAEQATLSTRQPKPVDVNGAELERRWHDTAGQLGIGPETVSAALGSDVVLRPLTEADVQAAFAQLEAPDGLTRHDSTFSRRDVFSALCDDLIPDEVELTPPILEQLCDRFLAERAEYVGMAGLDPALRTDSDVLHLADRMVWIGADAARYTTRGMLAAEAVAILAATSAPRRQPTSSHLIRSSVAACEARGRQLSSDQRAVLNGLAGSGLSVQTVLGEAGTGKTTLLDAFREVREREGATVIGLALSAHAVMELQVAGLQPSHRRTIRSFKAWLAAGGVVPANATVIVEEAGMVGTRDLVMILDTALKAGGEVVMVGDDQQLPEIEAGGLFRGVHDRLCDRLPAYRSAHELHEVVRQADREDVVALKALRAGEVEEALSNFDKRGRVFEGKDWRHTQCRLMLDWLRYRQSGRAVRILARSRSRVEDLNLFAQALRVELKELGSETVPLIGDQSIRPGDPVRFREKVAEFGVINGSQGTVEDVDSRTGSARIRYRDSHGQARTEWFGPELLGAARPDGIHVVELDYASTAHSDQGSTAPVTLVYVTDDADRQWAYTALSRHVLAAHLYTVHVPAWTEGAEEVMHGPVTATLQERLALVLAALRRDRTKWLATDHLARSPQGTVPPVLPIHPPAARASATATHSMPARGRVPPRLR